jgi:formylglycine-generating enzyme required for sulfatase activity
MTKSQICLSSLVSHPIFDSRAGKNAGASSGLTGMRFVLILLLSIVGAAANDMATIPAGEFTMGRTKETPDDKTAMRPHVLLDDRPARTVRLESFQIDTHEVTNAKYSEFVKAKNHRAPYHWVNGVFPAEAAGTPVYNVSWDDAKAYCEWSGKRLPTEAEWERAARGGLEGKDYPGGDQIAAKDARFNATGGAGPVGKSPANGFGLFDMAGNVAEWTADWFAGDYYKRGEDDNPQGPREGQYKVIRGGAWSDPPKRLIVFYRNWVRPNQRTPNIGFRCAK